MQIADRFTEAPGAAHQVPKTPEEGKTMKQVMIRIPDELVEKIEKMAKEQSRSRSNMIRVLIEQSINSLTKK